MIKAVYCQNPQPPSKGQAGKPLNQVAMWSGQRSTPQGWNHAGTAWHSAERRHRGRFRQSWSCFESVFDYFERAFDEERMRVRRTDPPAKRWMRVSRSPITIAQQPCLFSSTLLLPFNPSSLFMSLFLQFRSTHPCSAEINPRSLTSVEREKIWWAAVAGWWQSAGCPSYTAAHTPTGHWAPQLQAPQPSAVYFSAFAAHISLLSVVSSCMPTVLSFTSISQWLVLLLVSVWGPKQKGPVQPAAAAFAPPPQCNATKHSKQSDLTSGLSLSLSLQCLRKVKICGSALQYESAAGPQTPGKQSNANAATTCLPRPSQACRPPWVNLCLYFCATFWALPARCLPMMSC